MIRNILKILIFFNLLNYSSVQAQEIWRESFTVPDKGIWGNENGTLQSDFLGITSWTLEFSGAKCSNADDYAKTVATSGGRFEVRDIEGEVKWMSEPIEISGFTNVAIELTASETGSNNNVETKYLKAFYKIDEGDEIPFETNSENAGDWGSEKATQDNLTGEKLQIVVYLANNYSSDKVILDEVTVFGEENLEPIHPGDLVINEVLFNPFPDGNDYVEVYNHSENEIGLNRLYLASRDKDMELTQIYPLTKSRTIVLPRNYLALTKDTNGVFPFFRIECPECFLQMEKFPSYNNDEDYVVLLDEKMQIIDELYYTDKLHAPLLADEEGISLERISFSVPTNHTKNWHSASSLAGYGTPGYVNSQIENPTLNAPQISFRPDAFSPNFDGYNDEYEIQFQLDKPGYMANISIFDAVGRYIMKLANNEILGTNGTIIWNGKNETGQRQNLGVYVVLVEIFDLDGNIYRYKDGVVLTDVLE